MSSINIKLRPIRLAFLVDLYDKANLMEAIKINTFLWGGVYNPIIPVFRRVPKVWEDKRLKHPNSKEILSGYLDAFDPDFIVSFSKGISKTITGHRESFSPSEILSDVGKNGIPACGIGLFELLRFFINKELKFVREEPLDIHLFKLSARYDLFLASVFGSLSDGINNIITKNFAGALKAKQVTCSLPSYADFMTTDKLFLRRFSSLYITTTPSSGLGRGDCIFLLDATSPLDIMDYWNLRAVGWNVLPIPKQAFTFDNVKKIAVEFIEENFFPFRGNPDIYHHTDVVKSRTLREDEANAFIKSLKIAPHGKEKHQFKYSFQRWYPRIWDEWAREKDGVESYELETDSIQHELTDNQKDIKLRTLTPKFIDRLGYGKARFANEIKLTLYGGKEPFAEVIPEGNEKLVHAIGGMGFDEWRFSKRGPVYLSAYANWHIYLTIPSAEDVFLKWLEYKQWSADLSSPGRIAKQILKQLDGTWGIQTLANEELIKLLDEMSSDKTKNKEDFWGRISRIANCEEFIQDPEKISKRIMDANMFRLGLEVQCPVCRRHSWYSIGEADYEIHCAKCREKFYLPTHSPKEIQWSYNSFGPFSLPNHADGAYSVLLTLRFFSKILRVSTTPLMSFLAKKDKHEIEADLGILLQTGKFGNTKTDVIFAECKSYNVFKKEDAARMKLLAQHFPGAILIFATLNKELTPKEKELIRPVVNRGRRYWKADKPYNPVMILTRTELFSYWGPPKCWEGIGGKFGPFAARYRMWDDLNELCDITQQLYLDMKPWREWLRGKWEEKRKRKLEKQRLDNV